MAGIIENGVVTTAFVAPMSVISNQPAFATDSLSLKRQTVSQEAQRWEITTNLAPSNNSADFLIHSVVNGYQNVFQIEMPQVYRQNGKTTSTTCSSNLNAVKGATQVSVTTNKIIAKGEFIQFQNHSKVYLVTSERDKDGFLSIYPSLRQDVPASTVVIFGDNVRMSVRYELDTALGITYVDGIMSDPGSVKLIEAL